MGFLSSVGGVLNDITGATSSTANSAKYALQQQQIANAFTEKTMKNAHQWEMADLKAAGLNPALTLGGTGSAHGMSGTTASGPGTPANGMDVINSAASLFNAKKAGEKIDAEVATTPSQANRNNAEATYLRQQASNLAASNPFIPKKEKANIAKTIADTDAVRGGLPAKAIGTDMYKKYIKGNPLELVAPFIGGIGIGGIGKKAVTNASKFYKSWKYKRAWSKFLK